MKWMTISLLSLQLLNLQAVEINHLNEICNIEEMKMPEQANVQLIQKLLKGMLEAQNITNYDQFFAENIRMHGSFNGYEGDLSFSLAEEFDAWLAKAIKKEKMDIQEIFTHEDKVADR